MPYKSSLIIHIISQHAVLCDAMEQKKKIHEGFHCCSLHGEEYHHTNFDSLVTDSGKLWREHRIACLPTWVLSVKDYFSAIDPSSHWICLKALSACPLLVKTHGRIRIIVSLPEGCHLLPDHMSASIEMASSHCGYDEEKVLCTFLREVYHDNWSLMASDVDKAHRSLVALSRMSHGIRYIHNRVCKSARLPPYIEMLTRLPYHSRLIKCVRDMFGFVLECSKLKKGTLMPYVLTKPLVVTTETEWSVIEKCRNVCGFKWHRRHQREVDIGFGGTRWVSEWPSTFTQSHLNVSHFERWEERLLWVSVWYAKLRSKTISLEDSPKMLLLRFGVLLT